MSYQTIATRRALRTRRVVTRAAVLLDQQAAALERNRETKPAAATASALDELRDAARDLRTLI